MKHCKGLILNDNWMILTIEKSKAFDIQRKLQGNRNIIFLDNVL